MLAKALAELPLDAAFAGLHGVAMDKCTPGGLRCRPAAPLALNADAAFQVPADQCDPLNELCQAYVMAALLDANTGKVIPGYEATKCVVRGVDGTAIPLRWGNAEIWSSKNASVRCGYSGP